MSRWFQIYKCNGENFNLSAKHQEFIVFFLILKDILCTDVGENNLAEVSQI